ncbi:hypothetical protein F5X96DRAFT_662436 [Biscogniauxia mediterranea]|nr:hypothetical protein F5X96DRAFT_662436 [Biscogniauxia mediterranea]
MQFKTLALALFAAVAVSADLIQDLAAQVPPCAKSCVASFQIGCSTGDLIKAAFVCVQGACGGDDIAKATTVTGELCIALAGHGVSSAASSTSVVSTDPPGISSASATAAETASASASASPTETAAVAAAAAAAPAEAAGRRNDAAAAADVVVGGMILGAAVVAVTFAL